MKPHVAFLLFTTLFFFSCTTFKKRMVYGTYNSEAMHVRMDYSVYEPPVFDPQSEYPLVLFLHGGGDSPDAFDRHQISQLLDEAISKGDVPPALFVLPEGNLGFWADWRDRTRFYESWVMKELLPEMRFKYKVSQVHLMGISMGGNGALRFALHHPEQFQSVTLLSGPIFNADEMVTIVNDPMTQLFIPAKRIWGEGNHADASQDDPYQQWKSRLPFSLVVRWGDQDKPDIVRTNQRFIEHLKSHNILFTGSAYSGDHSWKSWGPVILESLKIQLLPQQEPDLTTPAENG